MEHEDIVRLRRARDRMDRDYAQPLDVPALAADALMSVGHFQRSFKKAYGEMPYSYLMTRRVERAQALLRIGELSVTDVCMATSGQHRGVDLGDRGDAGGGHHEVEFGTEVFEHLTHPVRTGDREPVDVGAADADR
ncbi:AraC family transcriptional regulator [Yimella sp. RIT 621]|nr:AraC family transcriptional regulator [Yimella sp. RIT 621]